MPKFKTCFAWMQAQVDAKVTEITYNQDSSGVINGICRLLGIPLRSSYCAGAVAYGFDQAGAILGKDWPKTGGSQVVKAWAIKNGRFFTDPQILLAVKGAVAGWTDVGNTSQGHLFCVAKPNVSVGGTVVSIDTAEANTTAQAGTGNSDREGGGFYDRTRLVRKGGQIWFIDTTGIPGGEWFVPTTTIKVVVNGKDQTHALNPHMKDGRIMLALRAYCALAGLTIQSLDKDSAILKGVSTNVLTNVPMEIGDDGIGYCQARLLPSTSLVWDDANDTLTLTL